jgi:RNA 2',3'-cyclic 3'-phosphodiesterase
MDPIDTSRSVRAFVAVAIPPPLVEALRAVQRQLQSKARADLVRWTKPEQLHLTLKFLGNVPANRLEALEAALNRACQDQRPFPLALEHLGCFPNLRNPRVIWVGIGVQGEALPGLHRRIEEAARDFGDHSEERAFQPHLTIGRVKTEPRRAMQVGAAIEQTPLGSLGEWEVGEVELMQSELLPEGARYSKLAAFALASS